MNPIEKLEQWLRWPSDATSLYRVSFWILLAIVAGLIAVLTHQSEVVWGLSALASGGLLGFLFGIPRVQQTVESAPSETDSTVSSPIAYRQTVNTNLTEISDWLTKIIVGVSLVQMTQIPHAFESLVTFLADEKHDPGFVAGVLVFFGVLGFLAGYLLSRLFLATAFSEADTAANNFNLISTQLPMQAGPQPSGRILAQIVRSPREAVLSNWELLVSAARSAISRRDSIIPPPRHSTALLVRLVELGLLDREQGKVFDELRRLRNIAAHSSAAITEEAATDYVNNAKALTEKLNSIAAPGNV